MPEQQAALFGEWEVEICFPEIPAEWLRRERWVLIVAREWNFSDGILHLEARPLVTGLQRVAETISGENTCQLFLVDNMSVALAFERCRCHGYRLLCQVRRFASYCLARNIRAGVRWIPSELNSADAGSIQHDSAYDASKELTGRIPEATKEITDTPVFERELDRRSDKRGRCKPSESTSADEGENEPGPAASGAQRAKSEASRASPSPPQRRPRGTPSAKLGRRMPLTSHISCRHWDVLADDALAATLKYIKVTNKQEEMTWCRGEVETSTVERTRSH